MEEPMIIVITINFMRNENKHLNTLHCYGFPSCYGLDQGLPTWGTCTFGSTFAYLQGYIYG